MLQNINNPEYKISITFKILLFFWCLLLIVIRKPDLLVHPRFWAEEGEVYFQFAYLHSFFETITQPQLGYYSFISNLSAYLATLVPLKSAPLVTTLIALFFQLIPIIIVINGRSIYWNTLIKKVIICVLIITVAESELWLNSINAQFHLVLATFLILIEPIHLYNIKHRFWLLVILIVALFTGPVACFLAPAFVLKAFLSKSKIDIQVAVVVLFCTVVQGSICVYIMLHTPHAGRFVNFETKNFVESYLSDFLGLLKVVGFNDKKNIGLIMLPYAIYLFYTARKQKEGVLFLLSFLLLTFLSLGSALNMSGAARYGFVPSCILFTLTIHQLFIKTSMWNKYIAAVIVVLIFTINIVFYQHEMNLPEENNCPNWKQEIAHWEADNSYQPKIYPCGSSKVWKVKLNKEK